MPKRNELRPFTEEEQAYLEKLSRSRTAHRHVERAIILLRYAAKLRPETV